jgi:hypothetical protein
MVRGSNSGMARLKGYILTDFPQLESHWLGRYPDDAHAFRDLVCHVGFCMGKDCSDIQAFDLPTLEERAEDLQQGWRAAEDRLRGHAASGDSGWPLQAVSRRTPAECGDGYGHAPVRHTSERANCREDGDQLIGKVFSTENPIL